MATYQYADASGAYHTLVSSGAYYDPYAAAGGGGGGVATVDQGYIQTNVAAQLVAPSSGVVEHAAAAAVAQSAAVAVVTQPVGVAGVTQAAGGGHLETLYGLPSMQGAYAVESVVAAPAAAACGGVGTTGSVQLMSTNPASTWGASGGYQVEVATSSAQVYGNIPTSYQSSNVSAAGGTSQLAAVGGGYIPGAGGLQQSSGGMTRGGVVGSGAAGYGAGVVGGGTSGGGYGAAAGAVTGSGGNYGRSGTAYGTGGGLGYATNTGVTGGSGGDGFGGASSTFAMTGAGRAQGQAPQQQLTQTLPQVLLPTTAAPSQQHHQQQQLQNQMQPLQQQQQQAQPQQVQQHMQQAQQYQQQLQQPQQYQQQQQVQTIQQQVQMQQQVQIQQQGNSAGGAMVRLNSAMVAQHEGHHHVQPAGTIPSSGRGGGGVGSSRGGMENRMQSGRLAPLPTPDRRLSTVHPSSGGSSSSLQQAAPPQQQQQQQQAAVYYHYPRYGSGNPGVGNGVGGLGMLGGPVGAPYNVGQGSGQVVRMDPRIPMVGGGGGGGRPVGTMYGSPGPGMGGASNVMNRQQMGVWYRPPHRMMGPGGGGGAPPVGAGRGYPSAPAMYGRPPLQSSASSSVKGGNFPPPGSSLARQRQKKVKKSQGPTSRMCRVCNVECNSLEGLREHMKGRKHTRMVEKQEKVLTASKVMEKVTEQENEEIGKAGASSGSQQRLEENGVARGGGGVRVAANGGAEGDDGERTGAREGDAGDGSGDGNRESKDRVEGEAALGWKEGMGGLDSEEEGSDRDEAPRRRRRRLERSEDMEMTGADDPQRAGMKRQRDGEEGRDGDGMQRRGRAKRVRGPPGGGDKPRVEKPKVEGEKGEGWCDVCQIDCQRKKVLELHIQGKKHLTKLRQAVGGTRERWERWGSRNRGGMGMAREMNTQVKEEAGEGMAKVLAGGGKGGETNLESSEPCVTLDGTGEPCLTMDEGAEPCVTVEGAEPCVTIKGAEPCVTIQSVESCLVATGEHPGAEGQKEKMRVEDVEGSALRIWESKADERCFTHKVAGEAGVFVSKGDKTESAVLRGNGIEQQQDGNEVSARTYAEVQVKQET